MMTVVNLLIALTFSCGLTFGHQLPRAQREAGWAPLQEPSSGAVTTNSFAWRFRVGDVGARYCDH